MNEYDAERFYGKFQVDYDFLKYFKFTYRMGLDTTTGQSNRGEPNLYALFYEGTPNGEGMGSNSTVLWEGRKLQPTNNSSPRNQSGSFVKF